MFLLNTKALIFMNVYRYTPAFLYNHHFVASFEKSVRSSHWKFFIKAVLLKNFTIFTGKYLCRSLFLNKVEGLSPATLLKKKLRHRWFPVNFVRTALFMDRSSRSQRFFKTGAPKIFAIFTGKHLGWSLL